MPQYLTRHFGTIEYPEDAVIEFPSGLPGFEDERRFLPVEHPRSAPIMFLQSLLRPEVCFITLPVLAVAANYELSISPEDLRALEFDETRQPVIGVEALCLAVISVSEGAEPTANLLAPIVVNLKTRRAVQAIQENGLYGHRHPLEAPDSCVTS